MRVLYYNWADYRDPQRRGGGVSVYQRNLIEGLARRNDIDTAFLSAGLVHDLRPAAPRIVQLEGGQSPRHTMINSGLVAPSHADFSGAAQVTHPATEAAFADFLDETGPWDIVHFNTLEGLPANVLALRARLPQTRFILSLHNYYPFCAQVNLWHAEREPCPGFDEGRRCVSCLPVHPDPRSIRLAYAIGTSLDRIGAGHGTVLHDRAFRPALSLGWRGLRRAAALKRRLTRREDASPDPALALATRAQTMGRAHGERRRRMVALINENCDAVFCVSDRVRQIAAEHGLAKDKLHSLHIGSPEADAWDRTAPKPAFARKDGTLRLAYLGYMRRDKGYYFLMRALANLPPAMARRVHLTVAAHSGESEAMALLDLARDRLASVRHVDGYAHDDLDSLLADVDLGVVPVLWEDNLPQVAIEMHARHIPLLTSDRGGARELGRCDALVFRAGDGADFARALQGALDGTVTPAAYWDTAMAPVTMDSHLDDLVDLYRSVK